MKKATAAVMVLIIVLFCFAGCKHTDTAKLTLRDGDTKNILTEKGGALATDQNGNFVEEYTDEDGKSHTQAVMLNTALVYGNSIYFTDYSITLPDGWSDNSDNSSYTQANIVDDSGNLITIRESDRTVGECVNANQLITAQVKKTYSDAVIVSDKISVGKLSCPFDSFYIPDAPDGTNPYTAYIVISNDGIVLSVTIESANDLTGKLDSIVDVLKTIKYNKVEVSTTATTAATTITTTK